MPVPLGHRTTGGSHGPPVVLLHPLGEDASTWDQLVRALADRPTIALDLRGHGTSPRPGDYSPTLMVDDVLTFLDARDLSEVDLVGHSLGGHVASLLAGRRPELVRRLVLEDTPAPPRAGAALPDDDPPTEPDTPPLFDWRVVTPLRAAIRAPNPSWWRGLPRITAPTLWIGGGPTSHVDQAAMAAAAATMPSAEVATIPVGHLVHTAAPEEFTRLVVPFLTRWPRPSPSGAAPTG